MTDCIELKTGMLYYAASAESASEHPLAQAIVEFGKARSINIQNPGHFKAVTGHGIEAKVDGKHILVGTRKLMKERSIATSAHEEKMVKLESEGKTAMLVAIDGELSGIIAVADTIKESSKKPFKH